MVRNTTSGCRDPGCGIRRFPGHLRPECAPGARAVSAPAVTGADVRRAWHHDVVTVPTDSAAMVGRDDDLAELRRAFRRASDGVPSAVLIEGEAGIGKTRLLREIQAE